MFGRREGSKMVRSFEEDLKESNTKTLRDEWERVLKTIFGEDIWIEFKDDKKIQLGFGTDITIKQKNGRRFSIELKTKRYELIPFNSWVLELKHHIYSDDKRTKKLESKDGWLYTSTAEYVIYGALNEDKDKIVEVCGFTLVPFKYEEFKNEISKLPVKFSSTKFNNGNYQLTVFCLATTNFLEVNANQFWHFQLGGKINDYF